MALLYSSPKWPPYFSPGLTVILQSPHKSQHGKNHLRTGEERKDKHIRQKRKIINMLKTAIGRGTINHVYTNFGNLFDSWPCPVCLCFRCWLSWETSFSALFALPLQTSSAQYGQGRPAPGPLECSVSIPMPSSPSLAGKAVPWALPSPPVEETLSACCFLGLHT